MLLELVVVRVCEGANQVIRSKEVVFTLPEPTKWSILQGQRNIIMVCCAGAPLHALVWREEYRFIFEDKAKFKLWLIGVLRQCQAEQDARMTDYWNELIQWVQTT